LKLPDFLSFEHFNRLRDTMGASELGHFTFFDPKLQLSTAEREALEHTGVPIGGAALRELEDLSLAYKNGRVLVYAEAGVFHLSRCEDLQLLLEAQTALIASTIHPESPDLPEGGGRLVCDKCLQRLRYKGFDMIRHRHRHYSETIRQSFSVADYFATYPAYPVQQVSGPDF